VIDPLVVGSVVAFVGTIAGCITTYFYLDRRSQRHERMVDRVCQAWEHSPRKEFDLAAALVAVAPSSEFQPGKGPVGWLASTNKLIGPPGSLGLPTRAGRSASRRGADSEGSQGR
jgi:hypothetical protein